MEVPEKQFGVPFYNEEARRQLKSECIVPKSRLVSIKWVLHGSDESDSSPSQRNELNTMIPSN